MNANLHESRSREIPDFASLAQRIRQACKNYRSPEEIARLLSQNFARWRRRDFVPRRRTLDAITDLSGISRQTLDESIDALLAPFAQESLEDFALRLPASHSRVGGFVMPANVPGSGIHELVLALISGAGAIIKMSAREPNFFAGFLSTLTEIDLNIGSRVATVVFSHEEADIFDAFARHCDFVVALGDDATIRSLSNSQPRLFGFGSRASAAVVTRGGLEKSSYDATADALARDIALFDQQGCLSPRHVFVAGPGIAETFALKLARALEKITVRFGPDRIDLESAAGIRSIRERARWIALGEHRGRLFEGVDFSWTVVFDPDASFRVTPGYRTCFVSAISGPGDLKFRLANIAGRLEAVVLCCDDAESPEYQNALESLGVCYFARPGEAQSPPLTWQHGGGAFLDFVSGHG